ncbi:MAG: S9 family peptidase [Ectothiorhodospiraceae bacterium]|nr:S9 family peptidase [Ectothiorhodospiraceae bacterium]
MSAPRISRSAPPAPVARRVERTVTQHGETRVDEYAWLRAADWRRVMDEPQSLEPEIRAHLEAENAHAEAVLAPLAELREALVAEMRARIKEDDASVPAADGAWLYYTRYAAGGQHPVFCRRADAEDATEEVLLDGDARAEGLPYFRVRQCAHSPDHRLLAWTEDTTGGEAYRLRVRDLVAGRDLPDVVERCHGDLAWAADSCHLYFTVLDEDHHPYRVYRHRLGAPVEQAALLYEEGDPGFFLGVSETESRRFVLLESHDHQTSEVRLVEADAPESTPRLVLLRERDLEYHVSHHGDRLLVRTNADGAEDFKIVEAPLPGADDPEPGREQWRDLVAHRPGVLLLDMVVFRHWLVRLERENALPRIVVRAIETGEEHRIAFEEEAYSLHILDGYEFDTAWLRFVYSSPTTPSRTYDYHMGERRRVLRKEQVVPSGHDPADYVTRRLHAPAHDGETIPVTLLHHASTPLDGSAPLLLYGYGAYGISMPADFRTERLSLVDRGVVYAIAHVRGGMERGYRWYRNGRREHKRNTFLDFVSVTEHLLASGIARSGGVAAQGGSAGGMLMGAVANMRPDLYAAIVAEVPFVDVLNTMSDPSLPLTPPEWPEWGNPIDDPDAYRLIRRYSPYENVREQRYPHLLVVAGLTDPRVTYWEPAKWVARLRARRVDDNLLLFRTNMSAGHGGASGRFERLEEVALIQAFLLEVFGLARRATGG